MSGSALKAEAILKALVSLADAFNAHDLDPVRREEGCARGIGRAVRGAAGRALRLGNTLRRGLYWTIEVDGLSGPVRRGKSFEPMAAISTRFVADWS